MTTVQPEILEALRECCFLKAPALILNPESGVVCHARFAGVAPGTVKLELPGAATPPPKDSSCCVSFIQAPHRRAFFARVLEYQYKEPPESSLLSLEISSAMIGIEARMAYRVPIGKASELKVRLFAKGGRVLLPKPIDLSYTGCLIEFAPAEDPGLPTGTELKLQLISEKEFVDLTAEIRRRDGHRYGLFFPEVIGAQGIRPPEALRSMLENLERIRLREKIR